MTVFGGDALGMKLHAVYRQAVMREPHHEAVVGLRRDREFARHAVPFDHERMITRRLERRIDAAEKARAAVVDLRQFAVHGNGRAYHLAAERVADGLMAETNAEDRDAR